MTRRTSRKLRSNSRRRSAITSKASKPKKIKFHWPPAIDYDTRVALGLPVHGGKSRRTSRRRSSLRRNGSAYFFQGSPAVAEQKIHQIRAAGGSDLKATKRYDGIWTVTFNADAAAQNALFGGSASNPLRHRGSGYGIGTPMEMNSRRRTSLRRNAANLVAIYVATTNNTSGNPRRGWIIGEIEGRNCYPIDFVDEGYYGTGALGRKGYVGIPTTPRIDITPGEYRTQLANRK
jgi:hypothetical protein